MGDARAGESRDRLWPFLAGVLAGGAGLVLLRALSPRRGLDLRLFRAFRGADAPPVVVVPGILGSQLLRPDGTRVWLQLGNAFGSFDLRLPFTLPIADSRDELLPGALLGTDAYLPRLFGFTEYADLRDLLAGAGFVSGRNGHGAESPRYHVFGYDWRRDLVESARRLGEALDELADASGDPDATFNVVGHSMGGLVARYYLRYGGAEPGGPVTWDGARRIRNLVLVATPNEGGIPSLDAILNGERVGLSTTTLAAPIVARMPSIYQLLPPRGVPSLVDESGAPVNAHLHDPETWKRFGWGPYAPATRTRRVSDVAEAPREREAHREFLSAVLERAAAFHRALAAPVPTPCPARVILLGGDCLPTLARAVVSERAGGGARFEPHTRAETEWLYEAGDGRVTRASVLASHLPGADEAETGCALPEVRSVFFGAADHHGIYSEPTFQSILLRLLLRPVARRAAAGGEPSASASEPGESPAR
jgi:pimeloyl-ACP methyl ester carboxylesterase